ncbi:glutamate-5-semialdehyde dehydrogenase, partial [bacterium]|nr:glutamate-5-semialdehyde dehydrogenase [bacterium]
VARAREAQSAYEAMGSQELFDRACQAVAWCLMEPDRNRRLAEFAVAETGLGNADDKVRKNHNKTLGLMRDIKGVTAFGHIEDDAGLGLSTFLRPKGVVAAIVPSTNPLATPVNNMINALKTGNAIILRGGKEAAASSKAIVEVVRSALVEHRLPADAVQLVDVADREAVGHFLAMDDLIDLAIPRGGESLIKRVTSEARMPVLKHFSGNCHVYIDRSADHAMARSVTVNAKCQRMGVCNAAESLLVHAGIADSLLPDMAKDLTAHGVELVGDAAARAVVPAIGEASEEDYRTEYLGPKMSVAIVDSLDAAVDHINRYGSRHTDAIIASDTAAIERFATRVDTAVVMVNASTRFNDGGELGIGAEIGISTDKLHASGPCGTRELTTYKYIVSGDGQVRG